MRLIRRYSNRRLYDIADSRTITLADLASLIRSGQEVRVIDTATNRDITLEVLGRIVTSEVGTRGRAGETAELLRSIITLGGSRPMSILKDTVLASIGAFNITKEKAEQIIDELIKKGELDKSDRKKAVMELVAKAEKSTADLGKKLSKEASRIQKEVAEAIKKVNVARQTDLDRLEAKVDVLTKAVKSLEAKLSEKGA